LDTAAPHTSQHSSQSHLPEKTRQELPLKISPYPGHQFRVRHQYTDAAVEVFPMAGEEAVHMEVFEEEEDAVSGKSILPERSLAISVKKSDQNPLFGKNILSVHPL